MKRLLLAIISVFLITNVSYGVTYNSNPKIFIEELIDDAMKTLSDKSLTEEKKVETIEEIALGNVDIEGIGMYTLGKIRKTLEPNDLERYNKLFEKYFLKTLTSRLSEYSSQKFKVLEATQKSAKYTIVHSKIAESTNQPEVKVDWRIYTKDPQKPLIRDLIIEGLSLARAQREEFASILSSNNNDINFLISKLEDFLSN